MPDRLKPSEATLTLKSCGYVFFYKLIQDCSTYPASYSFFVSIEKEDSDYYDEVLVRDVTSSWTTARRLFWLISDGLVTPMTLVEILEELL